MTEQLCGLLNLNKPAGFTSRRVVDVVAHAVKPARAGHAGTLDPMATGVLVVCIGRATRLIGFVQELPKTYRAQFRLGERSDTDDVTGNVESFPVDRVPDQSQIERLLTEFVGRIEQVPPRFSAVHIDGQRAYKLARKGKDVDLKPRTVEVHRIDLLRYEFPEIEAEIECGSGTYIRSIGRDLGEKLGCGAVMSELVRTTIGPFQLADADSPNDITSESIAEHLLPPLQAVAHLSRFDCTEDDLRHLQHGRRIPLRGPSSLPAVGRPLVAVAPTGELAAIGEPVDNGAQFAPRQVFL